MNKYEKMTKSELIKALTELEIKNRNLEELIQKNNIIMSKAEKIGRFGIWKWDLKTNKLTWSDGMYNLFGINREEFTGLVEDVVSRAVHPEDRDKVRKISDILSAGKASSLDFRIILSDGSERIVTGEGSDFIYDEEGRPSELIGYVQNITERKKSEAELFEKEMIMSKAEKIAHLGSWKWNIKTKKVIWSDEVYNIFGIKREDFSVNSEEIVSQCIHPEDRDRLRTLNEMTVYEGKPASIDYRIILPDGSEKIVRSERGEFIYDEGGNLDVIIGYVQDITERKKMEERINWLASFPEFNPGIVMELDLDGNIYYLNPVSKKLIGEMTRVNYKKQCFSGLKGVFDSFRKDKCNSVIHEVKIGKLYYQYMIYYTEEYHRIRIYGFEITKRKKIEEELIKHRYHLEELVEKRTMEMKVINENLQAEISMRKSSEEQMKLSLQEKEILLEEVHHRVKNNLQIISSLLSLQANYIKDKNILDLFKESRNRIKTMALIHEILYKSMDFGKIDAGEYLKKLTGYLFHSYGVNPDKVKMNINIQNISLKLKTAIHCGLIINELVSNSFKYAFPDNKTGKIIIDFYIYGDKFVIRYRDDGIGLPEELDFRSSDSLGLKLVMILTAQIDGDIELDRSMGTEFKITFKE